MDIIDKLNIFIEARRMAGKTDASKKSYERKHYRMGGKHTKKSSKERLERSAEGDKRQKRKKRQPERTPMGKGRTRYHV